MKWEGYAVSMTTESLINVKSWLLSGRLFWLRKNTFNFRAKAGSLATEWKGGWVHSVWSVLEVLGEHVRQLLLPPPALQPIHLAGFLQHGHSELTQHVLGGMGLQFLFRCFRLGPSEPSSSYFCLRTFSSGL